MRKILSFILAFNFICTAAAQSAAVDSVDVEHCDLALDLSQGSPFGGRAVLTVRLLRPCSTFALGLIGTVDTLIVDGEAVAQPDLSAIPVGGIAPGEPFAVHIAYHGSAYVEPRGFGGFHFDADINYNLGTSFGGDPHSIGRAVCPCRDNFDDKATYTIRVTTRSGWTAECSGEPVERSVDAEGREHSVWQLGLPVPTYIVGVSQAPYRHFDDTVGGRPLKVSFTTHDSAEVRSNFALLDTVVPAFERCFGPYHWGRIGYILTHMGSMEHANNIALAEQAATAYTILGQSTIAHELGHAWFGNLVTCQTEADMWINEGGASFASEVAFEAALGRRRATAHYQENLENVILTTHHTDGGYYALHGVPHAITYGSTTYDKGWMVWHSLRGLLGEERFYAAVRTLMERCAHGNIDAGGLCDSLSLYSGIDLRPFFGFHVFSPGFVDYGISVGQGEGSAAPQNVKIAVHAHNVGSDSAARGNHVPIAFFSADGDTATVWLRFSGTDTVVASHRLPFEPAFWVLDPQCLVSDAATVGRASTYEGAEEVDFCHFALRNNNAVHRADYYVEHHYAAPDAADTVDGVVRTANRYWVVSGRHKENPGAQGRFEYVLAGDYSVTYPTLDEGFYTRTTTHDSLALLWRPDANHAWQAVGYRSVGTRANGYLVVDNLRTGQYTLAVADRERLGLCRADSRQPQLFPNPVRKGERLTMTMPCGDAPADVAIFDSEGHLVWCREGCTGSVEVAHNLASGTYLVRIENKVVSLQSKLIVL